MKKSKGYFVGCYLTSEADKKAVTKLAEKFTHEKKVKYSASDIVRLAIDEFVKNN